MSLSSQLHLAINERRPLAAVLTITLPDSAGGGTLRLSDRALNSTTLGHIPDLIKSWGTLTRRMSDRGGNLETPAFDIAVFDGSTGPLARLGRRLEDAPASVHWAAEGVPPEAWSLRFTGRIVARRPAGRGEYSLRLAVDDRWLNRTVGPRLTAALWPGAPTQATAGAGGTSGDSVLGRCAPVAYGTCDSTGLGSHGLRRCLYIETVGPWCWLYSLGDAAVHKVFVDGQERPASEWTRTLQRRGGYTFTTVTFASWPGKDQADRTQVPAVTVDGGGIDLSLYGDNDSPAAQLRHLLEAFGRAPWDGAGVPAATLTDPDTWTALEAWCTAQGLKTGGVIGGGTNTPTLRQLLADILRGFEWSAAWTREGRLAVWPETFVRSTCDPPQPGITTWWVQGEHDLEPPTYTDEDPDQRGPGARVRYCTGPDGEALLELTALYPDRLHSDPDETTLPLGPQRVV